jgi:hypothetical protein
MRVILAHYVLKYFITIYIKTYRHMRAESTLCAAL